MKHPSLPEPGPNLNPNLKPVNVVSNIDEQPPRPPRKQTKEAGALETTPLAMGPPPLQKWSTACGRLQSPNIRPEDSPSVLFDEWQHRCPNQEAHQGGPSLTLRGNPCIRSGKHQEFAQP